ncbi:hypothetical protein [Mesorhizobium sp. CA4]|uniref:hypothetical protein n=1 Tax=Mesorhizobium sp. CA4 TaxID=588499 RepID=UPI001CD04F90|nr:hypothetical protein [Mesorhizobium sp. CA4]MBZ9822341.1 hypothetical protein [Mesorhizobium sp. CA4]
MKLVVTDRAPHLGAPGSTVEMSPSQAAYERLRGHVVEPIKPKPAAEEEAVAKPAGRGKRT